MNDLSLKGIANNLTEAGDLFSTFVYGVLFLLFGGFCLYEQNTYLDVVKLTDLALCAFWSFEKWFPTLDIIQPPKVLFCLLSASIPLELIYSTK